VRLISDGDTVSLEGTSAALEFLGHLLLAQARYRDCGLQFGPRSAVSRCFSQESTHNLYVHRLLIMYSVNLNTRFPRGPLETICSHLSQRCSLGESGHT
jgi:hypothetical protein